MKGRDIIQNPYTEVSYSSSIPLDIFTDTSSITVRTRVCGDVNVVASGFIPVFNFMPLQPTISVFVGETVPCGETKGIDMAVDWVKWFTARSSHKFSIRIFSDSLPSLQKIRSCINYVNHLQNPNNMDNSDFNVDVHDKFAMYAQSIALNIVSSGLDISLIYTPGHVPVYDIQMFKTQARKFIEKFVGNNNRVSPAKSKDLEILANYNGCYYMGVYNTQVDLMTRNYLFQFRPFIETDVRALADRGYFNQVDYSIKQWPFNPNLFANQNLIVSNNMPQMPMITPQTHPGCFAPQY